MTEVKLEKPGAGLPFLEALVLRYWVYWRYARPSSWEQNERLFTRSSKDILDLSRGLSAAQLEQRILIPRLRGLEDSSRYWSVAMTLEHLLIVGRFMGQIIVSLTQGKDPGIVADVAKVKPLGGRPGPEVVAEYEEFSRTHLANLNKAIGDRNSQLRHLHPWFGPISAKDWSWIMASHQIIHRQQLREIRKVGGF